MNSPCNKLMHPRPLSSRPEYSCSSQKREPVSWQHSHSPQIILEREKPFAWKTAKVVLIGIEHRRMYFANDMPMAFLRRRIVILTLSGSISSWEKNSFCSYHFDIAMRHTRRDDRGS